MKINIEIDLKDMERLKEAYEFSNKICDPLEFFNRKKILIDTFVEIFLQQLMELEKNEKRN